MTRVSGPHESFTVRDSSLAIPEAASENTISNGRATQAPSLSKRNHVDINKKTRRLA